MDPWTATALGVLLVAHLPPSAGVFGPRALQRLYGDAADTGQVTLLLLRHRAAGFATVALFAAVAVFVETWRTPALALGAINTASYLVLWGALRDSHNAATGRVAAVDAVALVVVIAALLVP